MVVLAPLALAVAMAVALRPARFWPLLTGVAVAASGVMIQGYALVDELLAGALAAGALLPIALHRMAPNRRQPVRAGSAIFNLIMAYLAAEGLRSLVGLGDWRMSRWIVFSAVLALLAAIPTRWRIEAPQGSMTAWIITSAGLVYLASYFGYGVLSEAVWGVSRWSAQGVTWSGSAYALFPLVLVVPAALFLVLDGRRMIRWTAIATIIMSMIAAFYYQSRTSWLIIVGFFLLAPTALGARRRVLKYALGLVALALLASAYYRVDLVAHAQALWESARALYAPRISDMDRRLHLQAALAAAWANPVVLLVGGGMYSHRETLAPYVRDLYAEYLPGVMLPEVVRTTGLPALLLDSGIIGLALFGMLAACTGREILARSRDYPRRRPMLLFAFASIFLWLLVSDIRDHLLFYAGIMPSGLLAQLSAGDRARPAGT